MGDEGSEGRDDGPQRHEARDPYLTEIGDVRIDGDPFLTAFDAPVADGGDEAVPDDSPRKVALEFAGREGLDDVGRRLGEEVTVQEWSEAPDQAARADLADRIGSRLAGEYGIEQQTLRQDPTMNSFEYGRTGRDGIAYNPEILEADSPEATVRTLAHEYRHAMQFAVIDDQRGDPLADQGVDRRAAWSEGLRRYPHDIAVWEFDGGRAYVTNPLEEDAFAAEERVWEGYGQPRDRSGSNV